MAKECNKLYYGDSNNTHSFLTENIKQIYFSQDGTAKKIQKLYCGDQDGEAILIYPRGKYKVWTVQYQQYNITDRNATSGNINSNTSMYYYGAGVYDKLLNDAKKQLNEPSDVRGTYTSSSVGNTYWQTSSNMLNVIKTMGISLCLFRNGEIIAQDTDFKEDVQTNDDIMVCIPRLGLKIGIVDEEKKILEISITNDPHAEADGFTYYAHTYKGQSCDKFYIGRYKSQIHADGKLYSTGQYDSTEVDGTLTEYRNAAHARGENYEQLGWYQITLIQALYLLLCRAHMPIPSVNREASPYTYYQSFDLDDLSQEANRIGCHRFVRQSSYHTRYYYTTLGIIDIANSYSEFIDGILIKNNHIYVSDGNFNNTAEGYDDLGEILTLNLNYNIGQILGDYNNVKLGFFPKSDSNVSATEGLWNRIDVWNIDYMGDRLWPDDGWYDSSQIDITNDDTFYGLALNPAILYDSYTYSYSSPTDYSGKMWWVTSNSSLLCLNKIGLNELKSLNDTAYHTVTKNKKTYKDYITYFKYRRPRGRLMLMSVNENI